MRLAERTGVSGTAEAVAVDVDAGAVEGPPERADGDPFYVQALRL